MLHQGCLQTGETGSSSFQDACLVSQDLRKFRSQEIFVVVADGRDDRCEWVVKYVRRVIRASQSDFYDRVVDVLLCEIP